MALPKICVTRDGVTVCAESDGTALTGSARDGKTAVELGRTWTGGVK